MSEPAAHTDPAIPPPCPKIPASLVPRAKVDYDLEARAILGFPLLLSDGTVVPPLTAGRLISLELVSSKFFLYPNSCDPADAAAAVIIATVPRELLRELTSGTKALDRYAAAWLASHGETLAQDYERIVNWLLVIPFLGFNMRPSGTPAAPREFWFDGSFCGAVLAPACRMLGVTFGQILWDVPLCLVGHAVAQHDAALGVHGVERQPDPAALDRMMQEACERELRGELHPWQRIDPIHYPLTATQAAANPDLIGQWDTIMEEWRQRMSVSSASTPEEPPDPASQTS